jgi:hypothetical protein
MNMDHTIDLAIRGALPKTPWSAKEFMSKIEERFQGSSKANASMLMTKMRNVKYMGQGSVREHIMKLIDTSNKLKEKSAEKTSLRCHALSEESRAWTNEAEERIWQPGGKWNLAREPVRSSRMSSARPEKCLAAVEIKQRSKIEQAGQEQRLDARKQMVGLRTENRVTLAPGNSRSEQ